MLLELTNCPKFALNWMIEGEKKMQKMKMKMKMMMMMKKKMIMKNVLFSVNKNTNYGLKMKAIK